MKPVYQEFLCALVHKNCKRDFTNPLRKSSFSMQITKTNEGLHLALRSEDSNEINWKTHCIFCGELIVIDKKHPDRTKKFFKTGELPSIYKLLSKCRERGDPWSEEVYRRISLSIDLVASDAIYHQQFKSNFLTKKNVPGQGHSRKTTGCPSNKPMVESFKTFCNSLD